MECEQETPTGATIPEWVQPSLFEPVFKEIVKGFHQIKDFKIIPALSAGENYATLVLRLEAEIELIDGCCTTKTLMLKTAIETEVTKKLAESHNVFDTETLMYREVLPEFEELYKAAGITVTFAPKHYQISIDHPYLLLENLKTKGYKNMNRLEGLDVPHTQAVLKILAQWHAASAVLAATKRKYERFRSFFKEENRAMMKSIYDNLTEIFLKCVKDYEGHELYYDSLGQYKDAIVDGMIEANKLDEDDFNVLNHGDCWSNNVMFKHDDMGNITGTYLLDYQVPHFGTPVPDLYYLLLSSTNYEIKLEKFDYFIKYYYDCLKENLTILKYPKKFPLLKDIHIMLHKCNAWAYNTCIGVLGAVLLDPTDKAKLDNYLSDTEDATEFKLQLYRNPRYRKHMELLLPWLYYRGVF